MEGIEKAVPSVQLSKKLLSYIDDALAQDIDISTKKELQQYSTEKGGSDIPFYIVRRVFQALKDAGNRKGFVSSLMMTDVCCRVNVTCMLTLSKLADDTMFLPLRD
jgi:hypothetical protein